MSFMVTFMVEGTPVPKGRPRFARRGKFVSTYSPKTTVDYETKVAEAAQLAMGSSEPLEGYERPTKKSDIDNYCKAVFDGMNGIVFLDDSQVVSLHSTKVYGTIGMVEVMVKEELG